MAAIWMQYKLSLMNKINTPREKNKTTDNYLDFSAYF